MFTSYFILFFLIIFIIIDNSYSEAEQSCKVANDCAYNDQYPYCRGGKCLQCDPTYEHKDCECDIGFYCVSDTNNTNYGTCQDKYSQHIIGSLCNANLKNKGMETTSGYDDGLFCGFVVYNTNNTAKVVEWEGSCQRGICYECSIENPIPTIPITYCPDRRSCLPNGEVGLADVGIFSLNFAKYNPVTVTTLFSWVLEMTCLVIAIGIGFYIVLATKSYYQNSSKKNKSYY